MHTPERGSTGLGVWAAPRIPALSFPSRRVRRTSEVLRVHCVDRLNATERGVEIIVPRPQIQVLQRGTPRPRFTWADRAFLTLPVVSFPTAGGVPRLWASWPSSA